MNQGGTTGYSRPWSNGSKAFLFVKKYPKRRFDTVSESIIQIRNLNKIFGSGETAVHALEDINLDIKQGEIYGIIGLSGAGKSTLVRCMNLLERPTSGEVIVDDNAIISSTVLMHQFCRIGGYTMIQGGSRASKDIPPYIIAGREPIAYCGLNLIGLRRRGFSNELIENIHNAYRIIYQSGKNVSDALKQVREEIPMTPEIEYIVSFIENSQRGIIR